MSEFKVKGKLGFLLLQAFSEKRAVLENKDYSECAEFCFKDVFLMRLIEEYVNSLTKVPNYEKSDVEAKKLREYGNKEFKLKRWDKSLKWYNDAVVVAKTPEETALAVANRSAALFEMSDYENCLADIKDALLSEYPITLKHKLFKRKALCYLKMGLLSDAAEILRSCRRYIDLCDIPDTVKADHKKEIEALINEAEKQPDKKKKSKKKSSAATTIGSAASNVYSDTKVPQLCPQLSYGENPKVRCMSNALKVEFDPKSKGRSVVAVRDLDPGDVLVLERPVVCSLRENYVNQYCWNCSRLTHRAFPCSRCSEIRFCSEMCRDEAGNNYHSYECGHLSFVGSFGGLLIPLRIIQKIGIKNVLREEANKMPKTKLLTNVPGFEVDKGFDPESYYTISSLTEGHQTEESKKMKEYFLMAALVAMKFLEKTIIVKFGTEKAENTLNCNKDLRNPCGSLVLNDEQRQLLVKTFMQLSYRATSNDCSITDWVPYKTPCLPVVDEEVITVATGLYPVYALFNHSCDPNAMSQGWNEYSYIRASKKIRKGEEVSIWYLFKTNKYSENVMERQGDLLRNFGFSCICEACVEELKISPMSSVEMPFLVTPSKKASLKFMEAAFAWTLGGTVTILGDISNALLEHVEASKGLPPPGMYTSFFCEVHLHAQLALRTLCGQCSGDLATMENHVCDGCQSTIKSTPTRKIKMLLEITSSLLGTLSPLVEYDGRLTCICFQGVQSYSCSLIKICLEKPQMKNDELWKRVSTKALKLLEEVNKGPENLYCRSAYGRRLEEKLSSLLKKD